MKSFRCTDVVEGKPACAPALDEQEARGAGQSGPSDDVRALCPADRAIPRHELDPALLEKLRSIGAADASDDLCCYGACVTLDVTAAPAGAPLGGITLCIPAPQSTSQPAAAFPDCPAAVRDRVFHDVGVLEASLTGAERAGTSSLRLSSKANAHPCCYDFPRKSGVM